MKKKRMSETKRRKLEHFVFNIMSKKDKGRVKGPAMTKKCGRVYRVKL